MVQHRPDPLVRAAPWLVVGLVVAITAWVVRIEARNGHPRVVEPLSHVHALVPDGETLWVATHRGLFSADADTGLGRVGVSARDLMGFTLGLDGILLASGHPDMAGRRAGEPSDVGLIESRDRGRSWTGVGLGGEADLHEIVALGEELLAWDVTTGMLLASADDGTWSPRTRIELFDLVHEADTDTLLATGPRGVEVSLDRGRTWRRTRSEPFRALAVDEGRWWGLDGAGAIWSSVDATSWTMTDDGMRGATAIARSDTTMWLAVEGTAVEVFVSVDDGQTWATVATP